MQTISNRIGAVVTPERLQLPPGGRAQVSVAVTNQGQEVDQFGLLVEGLDPAWYVLRVPTVNVYPGAEGRLELEIQLPEGRAAPAGTRRIGLRVLSRDEPTRTASVEVPLEVLQVGGLGTELVPRLVTSGGTGRFRLVLTSSSNAEQMVDLAVSDPAQALTARLDADRVAIPPGETREVPFALQLRRRPLIAPPQRYPFTVTVAPAGVEAAEPLGTAEGELVYRAPFAFLAALPPRTRKLLLALAALAVVAGLAVWFLAAPGRREAIAQRTAPLGEALQTLVTGEPPSWSGSATTGGGDGQPRVEPPTIVRFELSVPPNAARGEFALSWEVRGVREVQVAGNREPAIGSVRVQVRDDREFELVAQNEGGRVAKSIGLVLLRPPEITAFRATPEQVVRGQRVSLSWEASRAERAALDGETVDPRRGTREVQPDQDGTYTLVVENELGRTEQRVQVRVVEPS